MPAVNLEFSSPYTLKEGTFGGAGRGEGKCFNMSERLDDQTYPGRRSLSLMISNDRARAEQWRILSEGEGRGVEELRVEKILIYS